MASENTIDLKLLQKFGQEEELTEFGSMDFENSGDYFAAGDSTGNVWLYEKEKLKDIDSDSKEAFGSSSDSTSDADIETRLKTLKKGFFDFYGQFQSHEPGFDYLKSQEIEEKICMLKWLPRMTKSLFLLSTNAKTIKLWKIYERDLKKASNLNTEDAAEVAAEDIKIPVMRFSETLTAVAIMNEYKNAHEYHVHSISVNCDRETFLSADDLRIHIWNIENSNETFSVIDLKPEDMMQLSEVITFATFHPSDCQILIYGTNEGYINYNDMRISSKCDVSAKIFGLNFHQESRVNSFYSDMTSSITDIKMHPNGNQILARDYMKLRAWDLRREDRPLMSTSLCDNIYSNIQVLFAEDLILDRFNFSISADGRHCVSGTYGRHFIEWDLVNNTRKLFNFSKEAIETMPVDMLLPVDSLNFRTLNVAFHPVDDTLLITNNHSIKVFECAGK